MLKPGDRCRIQKIGKWWAVIHQPSALVVWAKSGPVWVDAIGFATGRKQ